MGAAHGKCTRVGPNCRDLAIGNWNVSSLTGKEQELVCEAQQYRLDVVEISSTKRRGSGTVELNGGWKIFYSGVNAAMSAQVGVGLLVSLNIAECVVDWVPLGGRVCPLKQRSPNYGPRAGSGPRSDFIWPATLAGEQKK